jgi:hypothetical protein
MAMRKALGSLLAVAVVVLASQARAEDEFDVSVSSGTIEVKAKGAWHVNKEGPWKVKAGSTTLDKSKFTLSETSAKVTGVPAGQATVSIYVCNGPSCKNATKTVTVN